MHPSDLSALSELEVLMEFRHFNFGSRQARGELLHRRHLAVSKKRALGAGLTVPYRELRLIGVGRESISEAPPR